MVEDLIKAVADFNQSNRNKTLITAACEQENYIAMKLLIKVGADVIQSDGKKTSLTTACERGHSIIR